MASIPCNYEINVAKKRNKDDKYGIHYCRIELPDTFRANAVEKLKVIKETFGDEYNVTMTYWECRGYEVEQ